MRDPERIDRLVEKLRLAWHRVPDWRLGQLVSNLIGPGRHDVFWPDDDRWEKLLDEMNGVQPADQYPLGLWEARISEDRLAQMEKTKQSPLPEKKDVSKAEPQPHFPHAPITPVIPKDGGDWVRGTIEPTKKT